MRNSTRKAAQTSAPPQGREWERQPGESARAYAHFEHYCHQDPATRSLKIVATAFNLHLSTVSEQSARYQWVARTSAFDEYACQIRLSAMHQSLARAETTRQMRELERRDATWRLASKLLQHAETLLDTPNEGADSTAADATQAKRSDGGGGPKSDTRTIVAFSMTADRLMRSSVVPTAGMPTSDSELPPGATVLPGVRLDMWAPGPGEVLKPMGRAEGPGGLVCVPVPIDEVSPGPSEGAAPAEAETAEAELVPEKSQDPPDFLDENELRQAVTTRVDEE